MKLKVENKYQLVGFIHDAETKRISLVEHAANEMPFAVVKSEAGVEWIKGDIKEDNLVVELKELAKITTIAPTEIKFPSNMTKEDVDSYMEIFEDDSFTLAKVQDYYVAKSKLYTDGKGNRLVVLPSGIAYTLNKFNISDTMKSEKEKSEMSKKTNEKSKPVAAKVDSKDELIAALKGLSKEDMVAILDEVLPEDSKETESKEEAESGEKEGTEETKESSAEATDEAKDEKAEEKEEEVKEESKETPEAESKEEIDKEAKTSEDFITALTEEFESQAEITKQLTEEVKSLTAKLDELTKKFDESSAKVEKSLDADEAIEVIAELQKTLSALTGRVDSLENTPADSGIVEKSAEVSESKSSGFLKKFI